MSTRQGQARGRVISKESFRKESDRESARGRLEHRERLASRVRNRLGEVLEELGAVGRERLLK